MIAVNNSPPPIFLAEDSEDDAFFFQRAFGKTGINCPLLRAENGKVAVEMLKQGATDSKRIPVLIFLDLKMPVMSGFEVLEWLRFSGLDPMPKVIVLSGSNDQDDRQRALNLGAADYLVKPIAADVLRERISAQLDLFRIAQNQARASV